MIPVIFFSSGFISIVLQTLLLREMLVVFQGNELSIGLILSHWLLGAAAGSYATARISLLQRNTRRGLIGTFIAACAYAILAFLCLRYLKPLLGLFPGEAVSLRATLFSSLAVFFLLSACIGAQFSLGARWAEEEENRHPGGLIYLLEAAGYLFGGIVYTYLMLPYLNPPAVIVSILCLSFFLIMLIARNGISKAAAGTALALSAALFFLSPAIERATLAGIYRGYRLQEVVNSPYNQLVTAERNGESSIFSNGIPLVTLPNFDAVKTEEFAHLPLLFHPAPKKVLVIGGAGKFIAPLLAHGISTLDYVELDPSLTQLLFRYWPEDARGTFTDPRLHVHVVDGRLFLRRSRTDYDVILIGLPYPVNLSLNHFYTAEFFATAKKRLTPGGVVALSLPGSLVSIDAAMARLNATIGDTMKTAFKHVTFIPGEDNILVASDRWPPYTGELKRRLIQRAPDTTVLSPLSIDEKFNTERTSWLSGETKKYRTAHMVNTDFIPRGMLSSLIYSQSVFAPRAIAVYAMLLRFSWVFIAAAGLWLLWGRTGVSGTAFIAGFTAMGLQMISIWGLQIFSGYLYHLIGAITAVFMAGLALGTWYSLKRRVTDTGRTVMMIELIAVTWISVWSLLIRLYLTPWPLLFFFFSAGTGMLLGIEFPLLIRAKTEREGCPESVAAGRIYSADLLGGWLAAGIAGTFFIPAWGLVRTMALFFILRLAGLKWWVRR